MWRLRWSRSNFIVVRRNKKDRYIIAHVIIFFSCYFILVYFVLLNARKVCSNQMQLLVDVVLQFSLVLHSASLLLYLLLALQDILVAVFLQLQLGFHLLYCILCALDITLDYFNLVRLEVSLIFLVAQSQVGSLSFLSEAFKAVLKRNPCCPEQLLDLINISAHQELPVTQLADLTARHLPFRTCLTPRVSSSLLKALGVS